MKQRKLSRVTRLGKDLKKSGVIKSFSTGENISGDRNYPLNKWFDKTRQQGNDVPSIYFEKTVNTYDAEYYTYEMSYTAGVTDEVIKNEIIPMIEKYYNPKRWVVVYKGYDYVLSIHHRDDYNKHLAWD